MNDPFSTESAVTADIDRDGKETVRVTVYIDQGIKDTLLIAKLVDGYSSSDTGVAADILDDFTQGVLGGLSGLEQMQSFVRQYQNWFGGSPSGICFDLEDSMIETNSDQKQIRPNIIDETSSQLDSIAESIDCSLSAACRYVITIGIGTIIREYDINPNRKAGKRRIERSHKRMRFAVEDVVHNFNRFIERQFINEERRQFNINVLNGSRYDTVNWAEWWHKEIIGTNAEDKIDDDNIEAIDSVFTEVLGENWRDEV